MRFELKEAFKFFNFALETNKMTVSRSGCLGSTFGDSFKFFVAELK